MAVKDRLPKIWAWIVDQFGVKSVAGLFFALISLIPDWQSRIAYWKEGVAKMQQQTWFPTALRILIFAVGVGLVAWDAISRSRRHVHRVRISGLGNAHVLYHPDHGYYSAEQASPNRTQLAFLVDVLNEPAPRGKISEGTGKVRANLRYSFRQLSNMVSPVAWCGEFFSFVNIEPGEMKQIILAVSPYAQDGMRIWNMVGNRRSNSGESISITSHEIPFLSKGTMMLDLISCDTGSIIATSEIGWEWNDSGMSSGPTYIKRLV